MEENIYYVYRHYKKDTLEVVYIGRSRTLNFKRAYTLQCTQRTKEWCDVYREFGIDVQVIAKNLTEDESAELEEFLITYYGRRDLNSGNLVNKCNGGKTSKGMIRSEEYKSNMSKNMKERYKSENNPFYQKSHTEESLQKMRRPREALKNGGHFRSKEVINIMTSKIYPNVRIASDCENIGYSNLRGYLRGAQPNNTPLLYLEVVNRLKTFMENECQK